MKATLRPVLAVTLATISIATTAWACPQPPPMRSVVTLVTTAGTTIPTDGGLLLRETMAPDFQQLTLKGSGAAPSVRAKGGAALEPQIDYFADGLQRWRFPTKVERDLEVVDADGTVIATLHQIPTGASALAAPRIKRLASTARRDAAMAPQGVPGSHMELDLATAPPARATTLVAELVDGEVPWFGATVPRDRRIVRDTFASKGCSGGAGPVLAGTRLRFAWLDGNGRRSAWTKPITVAFARAPRPAPDGGDSIAQ